MSRASVTAAADTPPGTAEPATPWCTGRRLTLTAPASPGQHQCGSQHAATHERVCLDVLRVQGFRGRARAIHRSRSQGLAGSGLPREPARPPCKSGRGNNQTPQRRCKQWGKHTTPRQPQPIELTTRKQAHTAPTSQQIAPTSQQTAPTRRPMTPTTAPLNYVNKPKPSTSKPGLSVNAKPTQQTRTNPREPA